MLGDVKVLDYLEVDDVREDVGDIE